MTRPSTRLTRSMTACGTRVSGALLRKIEQHKAPNSPTVGVISAFGFDSTHPARLTCTYPSSSSSPAASRMKDRTRLV